jgi:RAS guanyl-releasing protein 3
LQAVFKNYDHDKDGFISHAEFEAIAGNFPFIDSFAVLDADQLVVIADNSLTVKIPAFSYLTRRQPFPLF